MVRTKDVNNPKKRNKSVKLDKESFLIMKQIEKFDPGFNFSKFVNQQIKRRFRYLDREKVLQEQLNILIDEQDDNWQSYNSAKVQIIDELNDIRAKKKEEVEQPIQVAI